MTREKSFWDEVQEYAAELEAKGWLHKFFDANGMEYWELTPSGRKNLGMPPLPYQKQ
jgi:hypothetical protein